MSTTYQVLYNPLAGGGTGEQSLQQLREAMDGCQLCFHDVTKLESYVDFFSRLSVEDSVILAGGDGTLNRFINDTDGMDIKNEIFYYATGSGNDFLRDIERDGASKQCVNRYLSDLPVVEVNERQYRFLNGVGYGIDGYCCAEGDELRRKAPGKKINNTRIAIKGLLLDYHPTNATVTVDGKAYSFQRVWLAPTMNGRYYGGGMQPAPAQQRLGQPHEVSVMVMYGGGKIKTLAAFPSIFSGELVQHKDMVCVMTGREITVEFDRPTPLQIDGETIENVTRYTVHTAPDAQCAARGA